MTSKTAVKRPARIHPAAYADDYFFDKPRQDRSPNDFEFYYKHCSVDDRKPFPVGAIWACTTP